MMATSYLPMRGDRSRYLSPLLTFDNVTRSSVVQKALLEAWAGGTRFSVIVVDSRPMLEGISVLAKEV